MGSVKMVYVWSTLRIFIGWMFLWAFLDKTFGLGFATSADKAWIAGSSPTLGYLTHTTQGPFAEFFQSMATSSLVEWLFMLGILAIGIALVFGVTVRLGAIGAALMYILFYISGFIPPEHNPLIDEHIVNLVISVGIYMTVDNQKLGLGSWWRNTYLAQKYPLLNQQ